MVYMCAEGGPGGDEGGDKGPPAPHIAQGRSLLRRPGTEPARSGRGRRRMLAGQFALTIAAAFTGAAIYIKHRRAASAPSARQSLSPRRVQASLQPGLSD